MTGEPPWAASADDVAAVEQPWSASPVYSFLRWQLDHGRPAGPLCPTCGLDNDEDETWCLACGAWLAAR